ncbi:MAG TPA: type II toxin-antitoxin system prevent-host-death family antitoxin [Pedomonas sp.]|uniref:type II toxin-antitoxin system Phd/YefM family antitoxin n=1 Tax=Pedomonas sp. TaxID=2976421 RepID=UPI002F3EAB47
MDVMTYTDARGSLKKLMDRVIHDREPVVITREKNEATVMISLDDYNAIQETFYLLRSPSNARRLCSSMDQLEAGSGQERDVAL